MMTPDDVHRDVGAYALGVLDKRDSARFEEHLTLCRSCPRELEQLSSVAALLSHVDADSIVFAERSTREPRRSEALIGAVRAERRRARTRQGLTLAACLALVVAGAAVALSLGLGRTGLPGAPAPPSSAALKLHAVSQATGAEASMQVDKKRWGTEVTLQVTHVKGPVTCRLFAISKDGGSEAVMGWTVPADGYGTTVQPTPLILRGGTYIQTADITRYEVRTLDGGLLVSVPA